MAPANSKDVRKGNGIPLDRKSIASGARALVEKHVIAETVMETVVLFLSISSDKMFIIRENLQFNDFSRISLGSFLDLEVRFLMSQTESTPKRGRKKAKCIKVEQASTFHANLNFLYFTLNTTCYKLRSPSDSLEKYRTRFVNWTLLPNYCTLSRCSTMLETGYLPTINTVRKIVDFYNQNITPAVTVIEFLTQTITHGKPIDAISRFVFNPAFLNSYLGIYWSSDEKEHKHAAVISFYSEEAPEKDWVEDIRASNGVIGKYNPERLSAIMISGIRSITKDTLDTCRDLIAEYKHYGKCDPLVLDLNHLKMFSGPLELTRSTMTVVFSRINAVDQKQFLLVNTNGFLTSGRESRPYLGGNGFLVKNSGPKVSNILLALQPVFEPAFLDQRISLSSDELDQFLVPDVPDKEPVEIRTGDSDWFGYLSALRPKE